MPSTATVGIPILHISASCARTESFSRSQNMLVNQSFRLHENLSAPGNSGRHSPSENRASARNSAGQSPDLLTAEPIIVPIAVATSKVVASKAVPVLVVTAGTGRGNIRNAIWIRDVVGPTTEMVILMVAVDDPGHEPLLGSGSQPSGFVRTSRSRQCYNGTAEDKHCAHAYQEPRLAHGSIPPSFVN